MYDQKLEEKEIINGYYQRDIDIIQNTLLPKAISLPLNQRASINLEASLLAFPDHCCTLLFDRDGLRCAVSVPLENSPFIEIQVVFFSTIDFRSCYIDLEAEGPGQETLKKHEKTILKKLDAVCGQVQEEFPLSLIRVRLSGHSLGGTLAKGFAFSLQRALAVLREKPDSIIRKISKGLGLRQEHTQQLSWLDSLNRQLTADSNTFKELSHLGAISAIVVYALGAPGLGIRTNRLACLMTYFYDPRFLSVYHHHHKKDLFVAFGKTEFLSNKDGIQPRVTINKDIEFDVDLTSKNRINVKWVLPFPGITIDVMAYHNKSILDSSIRQKIETQTKDLQDSALRDKSAFSKARYGLYRAAFFSAQIIAVIKPKNILKDLSSYPEQKKEAEEAPIVSCFF